MSEGVTLTELSVPLWALRLLAADFGHLSAPTVCVTPIWPERLELSFHGDLVGFEAWRDALGIAPDAVEHRTQNGGRTRVLLALGEHVGATVRLVAFADVPAVELAGETA